MLCYAKRTADFCLFTQYTVSIGQQTSEFVIENKRKKHLSVEKSRQTTRQKSIEIKWISLLCTWSWAIYNRFQSNWACACILYMPCKAFGLTRCFPLLKRWQPYGRKMISWLSFAQHLVFTYLKWLQIQKWQSNYYRFRFMCVLCIWTHVSGRFRISFNGKVSEVFMCTHA